MLSRVAVHNNNLTIVASYLFVMIELLMLFIKEEPIFIQGEN